MRPKNRCRCPAVDTLRPAPYNLCHDRFCIATWHQQCICTHGQFCLVKLYCSTMADLWLQIASIAYKVTGWCSTTPNNSLQKTPTNRFFWFAKKLVGGITQYAVSLLSRGLYNPYHPKSSGSSRTQHSHRALAIDDDDHDLGGYSHLLSG